MEMEGENPSLCGQDVPGGCVGGQLGAEGQFIDGCPPPPHVLCSLSSHSSMVRMTDNRH